MATLYFNGVTGNQDWSNVSNWYNTLNANGTFSSPAGRLPNASDTAIICGVVGDITGDYTNPAVLQLGTATPYIYIGGWNGDGFSNSPPIAFNLPIVNAVNNGLSGYNNTNYFWASLDTGCTYTIGTMNLRGYSSFSGQATITTANFYDYSVNGGYQDQGIIQGTTAKFYNYSSNGAGAGAAGDNSGTISGNATFYNYSSNCPQGGGDSYIGTIYGNAVFNDYSRNAIADNANDAIYQGFVYGNATFNNNASNGNVDTTGGGFLTLTGVVQGQITYTSTSSFAETLQAGANATTITMPATGISQSKALLNRLLKLPFPVVIQ